MILHYSNLEGEVACKDSHGPQPQHRSSHCSYDIAELHSATGKSQSLPRQG